MRLCPDETAGPVPWARTSVVSFVGAGVFGTVRVGFCPKAPVTFTPTLLVAWDDDEDDGLEEVFEPPLHAARLTAASRLVARTTTRPRGDGRRDGRAESFTGDLRRRGKRTLHGNRPSCAPGPAPRSEAESEG